MKKSTSEMPKIPSSPDAPTYRVDVQTSDGVASTLNLQLSDSDIKAISTDPAVFEAYHAMISRQSIQAARDNVLLKYAVQISRASSEITAQCMNSILELNRKMEAAK